MATPDIHTDTDLTPSLVSQALEIRAFEELLLDLYGEGHIRGTVHTCLGQELLACVLTSNLEPYDLIFGTHRGHGFYLSLTRDYEGLAREILGRDGATSRGIGGSQHLHAHGIVTNGVQGGLVPIAAGSASTLTDGISVAVFGDGTLGQGVLYESLNIAALQNAPVLFLLEDNGIAQTTPQIQNVSGSIRLRFEAFGIRYFTTNDTDPTALAATSGEAVAHVRQTRQPAALHITTKRLGPHSKGDDNRPENYLEELRQRDFLSRATQESDALLQEFQQKKKTLRALFDRVIDEPRAGDSPRYEHSKAILGSANSLNGADRQVGIRMRQQLTNSLRRALEADPRTWLIGEDVEYLPEGMERGYSGAFGVSDDLSRQFPGQVRNFPISEAAITGFAVGRAMGGSPTISEIMFGDFSTLTLDQLRQQASKMVGVYRDPIQMPFLLRTPMGGRRGYGPTHSQSFEGIFLGIPNTVAYSLSPFGIAEDLIVNLLGLSLPTVLLENKDLYGIDSRTEVFAAYALEWPTNALDPIVASPKHRKADATIVTYGFAAELTLRALELLARKHEIFVDVLVYEVISPLDALRLESSLKQTHRLGIIEEGTSEMGLGSTVLAALAKRGSSVNFTSAVLGAKGDIGASQHAEKDALPDESSITEMIAELAKRISP